MIFNLKYQKSDIAFLEGAVTNKYVYSLDPDYINGDNPNYTLYAYDYDGNLKGSVDPGFEIDLIFALSDDKVIVKGISTVAIYSFNGTTFSRILIDTSSNAIFDSIAIMNGHYITTKEGTYKHLNATFTLIDFYTIEASLSSNCVKIENRIFITGGSWIQPVSISTLGVLTQYDRVYVNSYTVAPNLLPTSYVFNLNGKLAFVADYVFGDYSGVYLYSFDETTNSFTLLSSLLEYVYPAINSNTSINQTNKISFLFLGPYIRGTSTHFKAIICEYKGLLFYSYFSNVLNDVIPGRYFENSDTGYAFSYSSILDSGDPFTWKCYQVSSTSENVSIIVTPGV